MTTSTIPSDKSIDALIGAWRETGESLRDAIRFRWSVTTAYLIAMATAVSVAGGFVGKPQPLRWWEIVACDGLMLVALGVQWRWQGRYNKFIERVVKQQDALRGLISCNLSKSAEGADLVQLFTLKDVADGYRGIIWVSVIITLAAVILLGW